MKLCTDSHGAHWMNPNDFRDPLTFHLVPPAGQTLHLSSDSSTDEFSHSLVLSVMSPNDFGDLLTFPLVPAMTTIGWVNFKFSTHSCPP